MKKKSVRIKPFRFFSFTCAKLKIVVDETGVDELERYHSEASLDSGVKRNRRRRLRGS